ncbi:T9SS type A sorting domain-containing protein [candidate division WOR-3 bacterium]|nr:T9SS type A sorting domain-containing protein [candidate division WOR-3 bacterium]
MTRNVLALSALLCSAAIADLGIIDTVGGTIYDWQYGWCAYRYIAQAPGHGIHVTWIRANDTTMGNPDRNMRYNYYDFSTRRWSWMDRDFMLSGTTVFGLRSGLGNLDADPVSGAAVISTHLTDIGPIYPCVARDIAPGAGIYEFCSGYPTLDGFLWPLTASGQNRTIHMACIDDDRRDNLFYSRAATWCNWDPPIQIASPPPEFPSHNLAASKVSNRVCVMWIATGECPYRALFCRSSDGGTTWDSIVDLGYPPAFGPDTTTSYYITSSMPFYDRRDQLHIVVDVMPIINDSVFLAPVELWHWCEANSPVWSRIHRADADPRGGWRVGSNALFACRPSIGEDTRGNLFVSWEQFDTTNVEPLTGLLRGDIWVASSSDNGQRWQPGVMITRQSTTSHRFPCMVDLAIPGGPDPDTIVVLYEDDSVAGFKSGPNPTGPWSHNPYIAHKVPVDAIVTGVAEGASRPGEARSQKPEVRMQNPVSGRAVIRYSLPVAGDVSLVVLDAAGRVAARLVSGRSDAGGHVATWHAPRAGVYFCQLTTAAGSATSSFTFVR